MKISIIGHCGSGKSTLARNIATKKNIPHLELDRLFFLHNGAETKDEESKAIVKEKIKGEVSSFIANNHAYVIDGVYITSVQPIIIDAVDMIVYIDIPLLSRMWNHLKRWWRNKYRHSEVSRWEDLFFVFDMMRRTKSTNKKLPGLFALAGKKLRVLKNYTEVQEFLDSI